MNTDFNECRILSSFNIPNIETLEADGDTLTQIPSKQGIPV